jgi:hypothetical protein
MADSFSPGREASGTLGMVIQNPIIIASAMKGLFYSHAALSELSSGNKKTPTHFRVMGF